jgi:hypothetical protein
MKAIFTMHKIVVVLRFDDVYRVLLFIETLPHATREWPFITCLASRVLDTVKRNKSDKNSYETRHQHGKPELITE